jgi:hypothetical protein
MFGESGVSVTPSEPADHPHGWPVSVTFDQLARWLHSLGIDPGEFSPVRPHVDLGAMAADAALPCAPNDLTDALAVALRVVAEPCRVLLLVQVGARGGEARVFLQERSGAIVRFDLRREGCVVSAPSTPDDFVRDLCQLLALPDGCDGEEFVITRRMLFAVAALRGKATVAGDGWTIPTATALDALAPALSDGIAGSEVIALMAEAGVLTLHPDALRLSEQWYRDAQFLFAAERTMVYSIELADLGRGVAPRRVVLLGEGSGCRVAAMPSEWPPSLDQRFILRPASRPVASAAIYTLVCNPPAPPAVPRAGAAPDLDAWLGASAPRDSTSPSEWSRCSLARAVAGVSEGRVPAALLHPRATIAVRERLRGRDAPPRTIAIGDREAVEWLMSGSLVHWRSLSADGVALRLGEMLPATEPVHSRLPPVFISRPALRALMSGRATDYQVKDLPACLSELIDASTARWCSIRALRANRDGVSGVELLFACDDAGIAWRFEPEDQNVTATRTDPDELWAELRAGLSPSP